MEQKPGQCPFLKQACIGDRCQLYLALPIVAKGQLVGSMRPGEITGCAFVLIAHFLGRLNVIATPPPPPPLVTRH